MFEIGLTFFWRGKEGMEALSRSYIPNVFEMLLIIYLILAWTADVQFFPVTPLVIAASADQQKRIRWDGDKHISLHLF